MKNIRKVLVFALAVCLFGAVRGFAPGLKAQAAAGITVTWDAQGGRVYPLSSKAVSGAKPPAPMPTKSGYIFKGWYSGVNGGGTAYAEFDGVTADTTLYAFWELKTANVVQRRNSGYYRVDDRGVTYKAPILFDNNGLPQYDADGYVIFDRNAPLSQWEPVAGFMPGDMGPDESGHEPPFITGYQNIGTLHAFVAIPKMELLVLDIRNVATESGVPAFRQLRDQPVGGLLADPYDLTGVGFTANGEPVYIPQRLLPGYAAQAGQPGVSGGDLVLAGSAVDPDNALSWGEAGKSGLPMNEVAYASKAQMFSNVNDPSDDTLYAILPGNYAFVPGNPPEEMTSVPINILNTVDWRTNARYIDNWYGMSKRGVNARGEDVIYPGTKLSFDREFTATQADAGAVMDTFGVDYGDLMQAFCDEPWWGGDGRYHSWLYLMCKYNPRPDILDVSGWLDGTPGEAARTVDGIALSAEQYAQLMAAADFWSVEGYLSKLPAKLFCPADTMELRIGARQPIPYKWNGVGTVSFTTSGAGICDVTADGILRAVTAGEAVITLTAPNGSTAEIHVTVIASADKTKLGELIAYVEDKFARKGFDAYTAVSVGDLLNELDAAKIVYAYEDASQDDVDVAYDALQAALDNLKDAKLICTVKSMLAKIGKLQPIPLEWDGYGGLTITTSNPAVCTVTADRILVPLKAGISVITIDAPGNAKVVFAVTVSA